MPSLAIRSFSYDQRRNELTVTFTTGRGYVYSLVPPDVAAAFAAAASKGRFLNERIRDRYPYRKTKAPSPAERPSLRNALAASTEADDETATPASGRSASRNDESPDRG